MNVIDYELTCDISYLFEKKIFIYGTGMYGNKVATVFSQMKIAIDGFCETNPLKKEFLGKRILSINSLISDYDKSDVLIIIASEKFYKEMINELQTTKNMFLCTYYALFLSLHLKDETEKIPDFLKKHIKFYKKASIDMAIRNFSLFGMKCYCDVLFQKSLVWIYQPGKVGSLSIYYSNPKKIYHIHTLANAFNGNNDVPEVCKSMIGEIKKNPIRIITGIREPISRDMSSFFQSTENDIWPLIDYRNCLFYLYDDYSKNNKSDIQILKERVCTFEKDLNFSFEHLGKEIAKNKSDEFSWFDYEIKSLFGIDIYSYPFDKEKGYAIIEQDNIRILVYKCEKLNQLEKVIGEFLDEPEFTLINANQGEKKIYSYVYKRFKEEVKLNKEYFDYYYADNPKLKHFYTNVEIEQFKQKWEKKLQ